MRALGLMSGTSADGVDAAIIETDGIRVTAFGPALSQPYPPALRRAVLAAMRTPDADHTELEAAVTAANAEAASALIAQAGPVDVVGLHGQTIIHRPDRRFTLQLGDGPALARALDTPVVNRFRHADVAAGGQGAPLVPVFHQALLHGQPGPIAVLNLGGVANVTYIDGDTLIAFDTGPASAMIDDWTTSHTGAPYDLDGALAAAGQVDDAALAALLDNPYFGRRVPKSLDRNAFPLAPVAHLTPRDGAATLTEFTARSVALARDYLPAEPRRWIVAGGGRHNPTLMRRLTVALTETLATTLENADTLGWNGDALEAQAFAFLAVRSLAGLPLSYPTTTGVPAPMPGGELNPDERHPRA